MSKLLDKWNATAVAPGRKVITEFALLANLLNDDPPVMPTTTAMSDQPGVFYSDRGTPVARFVGQTPARRRSLGERMVLMLKGA